MDGTERAKLAVIEDGFTLVLENDYGYVLNI